MKQIKKLFFYLTIIFMTVGCDTETEICDDGVPAKLYYTPDCATINGYITLDNSGKTFVFQEDIEEEYQMSGIEVCIEYKIEKEPTPLTAECTQADIIIITSLQKR